MTSARGPEGPPTAFEAVGWLGLWLTDGESLVQVVGLRAEGLFCEDALDGRNHLISFEIAERRWRKVNPRAETAA